MEAKERPGNEEPGGEKSSGGGRREGGKRDFAVAGTARNGKKNSKHTIKKHREAGVAKEVWRVERNMYGTTGRGTIRLPPPPNPIPGPTQCTERLTTYCGRFGSIASYNCSTLFDGMLTFPCKDKNVRQLTMKNTEKLDHLRQTKIALNIETYSTKVYTATPVRINTNYVPGRFQYQTRRDQ